MALLYNNIDLKHCNKVFFLKKEIKILKYMVKYIINISQIKIHIGI